MTIHKSKGLEFPVVVFPYDLDIYRQVNPKVWLNELPENFEGFNELLVPFNKEISYVNKTGLEIYQQQRQALELDNFNLLYVALTRAIEQLHIVTEKKISAKGEEKLNFYSGIFINYLKKKGAWNDEVLEYSLGDSVRKSLSKEESSRVEIQKGFISSPWQEHNIVMLASSSKLWDTEQRKAIDYGNLVHEMMANIITKNDIEKIVNQYKNHGELPLEKVSEIEKKIKEIVNHVQLKTYFSENITIHNEREIVDVDGQIIIPDRLVFNTNNVTIMDYKTGKPDKKYYQQLLRYERVLKSMKFNVDKKILIYINQEILIEEV